MVAPAHNFQQFHLFCWSRIRSSEAGMGGGAQRPVWLGPKERVRAAHGRARAVKTHQYRITILYSGLNIHTKKSAKQEDFHEQHFMERKKMENQTKTQRIITFRNSISGSGSSGRNRENTQESIRHWELLISGQKKQGKYSGKHQTLGIIDQWLEDTGKILSKTSDTGDY